ncbi:GFA family protein [Algiphilus sp.]|uniref:GFA family protein n=1 Tax=Algiphilus sp. TaxID=1872431 RepID=UPI003B528F2C
MPCARLRKAGARRIGSAVEATPPRAADTWGCEQRAEGTGVMTSMSPSSQVENAVKHVGGCLCGAVRFEVSGAFEGFFLCHCSHCRKGSGSSHAANLFSADAELRWLSGEPQVAVYHFPETRHVRSFCTVCGSALPTLQMNGALGVVPAGSLDTDVPVRPQGHIFMDSRANWDEQLETLPQFGSFPT